MENEVQKGEQAISFIESLVDKGVLHKDLQGNINRTNLLLIKINV
jgi:hypothetical protein